MAPQPSSPEFTGEVVAAAKEAMVGAREGLVMLAVVVQRGARSLGAFGALERPLGMLAGDEEDGWRAWWLR